MHLLPERFNFLQKLDFIPRRQLLKILLILLLVTTITVLFLKDLDLLGENEKMLKFISKETSIRNNLQQLEESNTTFSQFVVPINEKTDKEKIKTDTITLLMQTAEKNNVKVDSYRVEVEEKDGFTIFKYNMTLIGQFIDIAMFFHRLPEVSRIIMVATYEIKLNADPLVHMGLNVEVAGVQTP